jgi:hypothetical protein
MFNSPWILVLTSCALSALIATVCCWLHLRHLRKRFSLKNSVQLSREIIQLRSDLDSTLVTVKRLHAKYGMRAVRGERKEAVSSSLEPLPGETRAQWKLRLMRNIPRRGTTNEQEE